MPLSLFGMHYQAQSYVCSFLLIMFLVFLSVVSLCKRGAHYRIFLLCTLRHAKSIQFNSIQCVSFQCPHAVAMAMAIKNVIHTMHGYTEQIPYYEYMGTREMLLHGPGY